MIKVRKEASASRCVAYHHRDLASPPDPAWPAPRWLGQGAHALGLQRATVSDLQSLLEGLHPHTLQPLRRNQGKVCAWRFVVSAPRSVSLAAIYDDRVRTAFSSLARDYIEHFLTGLLTREQGINGLQFHGAECMALAIDHFANSIGEPLLHLHAIVPNLGRTQSAWRAIWSLHILEQVANLSSRFDFALRKKMETLGYRTRDRGLYWHVAGVLDSVPPRTQRQEQIDSVAECLQGTTNAARTRAAVATRPSRKVEAGSYEDWLATMRSRYAPYPSVSQAAQSALASTEFLPLDEPAPAIWDLDEDLPSDEPDGFEQLPAIG